jgi:hypothetical protein
MWWLPIAAFAQNKMQEKKAKEEAAKLQTHAIRSQLASSFGAPTYGAQTARSMYDTQRQIDAQAAQNNRALMEGAFGEDGFFSGGEETPDPGDGQGGPSHGPGSAPPSPDGEYGGITDEQRRALEDSPELRRARGYR